MARLVAACTAIWLAAPTPSSAQVSTGRIDASINDATGAVLPGVIVDISGPQSHSAVTDNLGEVHFLNLAPGTYTVSAKLSGFSDYLNKNVLVSTGASVPLKIAMSIAGVATQVQVTDSTPTVDTKKVAQTTHVGVEELQSIPSSRDPWVVLQTVPGIIVDRVNVGGAESGQQSNYQAKGASGTDNTWNIDGIAITDMAATGSTPTYYDFDMFQEMQVTTGGADVTSATPGVQLNMVLKSGTNTPHGSTRIYYENEDMQANNMSEALAASIGGKTKKGNRMSEYKDYGFELGGPIVRDRLWAWGAVGKTDVDILTLLEVHDRTELQDTSFKVTGQATKDLRLNFTFFRGNKLKFGRGASATRPDETTWNQEGPTPVYKGEGNLVVGNTFFLSGKVARTTGKFTLTPRGGMDKDWYVDDSGVSHQTYYLYDTTRPQSNVTIDANSFRGHHELKFGFGWRKAEVSSTDAYAGTGIITYHIGYPDMLALIKRDFALESDTTYLTGYAGDTISMGRATLNLGLRWDRQSSSLGAATVPANKTFPTRLPSISTTPVSDAITWNSVTPRIGLTYALGENRKTILRTTYSMFASQLGSSASKVISTIQYTGIYYYAIDLNGNRSTDANEVLFGLGNAGYYGFDPLNPGKTTTNNKIGDYATPMTHEFTFGADRELMPNFGLSASFTWRNYSHFNWNSLIGVNSTNYRQTGTLTGNAEPMGSFSVPFYALDAAKVPPGAGTSYEERLGYSQRYLGFEISGVKRLSNRWMARFGFSTNSHREYFDGADAIDDPTPGPTTPNVDGGLVITQTTGSGKSNIYMLLPRYQFVTNGMYQAPWGINLGANWVLRQGYGTPFFRSSVATGDPLLNRKSVLAIDDVGNYRLPAVSSLDARIEKAFRIQRSTLALDLDIFNITNAATVLGRTYDLRLTGATGYNQVAEIMNPRILRLGARFTF